MNRKSPSPFAAPAYKTNPYAVYADWCREPVHETTLPDGSNSAA